VVDGPVVSQILTLYVTPVMYVSLERLTVWLRRHRPQSAAVVAGGSEVAAK
jgi:hypothetical protein